MFDSTEYKERKNIIPIPIKNKEEYYLVLDMIGYSTTGRIDAQIVNGFLMESAQLIINAIVLFEKGYFDNASYSLRQSLEIATTMIYLIELEPAEKEEKIKTWKEQGRFPFQGEMLRYLEGNKEVFFDVKRAMFDHFDGIKMVKEKLNKVVHKQGYEHFYVIRMSETESVKRIEERTESFIYYLEKCIGALAVMRLMVDPFPVLLMNEEIYKRTGDIMTDPFTKEFVDKYIGLDYLELYKKTLLYKEFYEQIMQWEPANLGVLNILRHQLIERNQLQNVNRQKHLLSINARVSVLIAMLFEHVSYIHINEGLLYFFTETKTNRQSNLLRGRDGFTTEKLKKQFNNTYSESFISYISFLEDDYFIEHNQSLSKADIEKLMDKLNELLGDIERGNYF